MERRSRFNSVIKENDRPNTSVSQVSIKHRKRSSSLFALNELFAPSPPLSPSVSINFNKCSGKSGEIPILLDFLTTSSMPSDERLSQMANLKPELPPLARFSPMTAFFPMSDSFGTIDTIGTQAFGSNGTGSSSFVEYMILASSNKLPLQSPLDSDLMGASTAEEEKSIISTTPYQKAIRTSLSMPEVQVQDYDKDQKVSHDTHQFTTSAYLTSPFKYGDSCEALLSSSRSFFASDLSNPSPSKKRRGHVPLTVSTGQLESEKIRTYEVDSGPSSASSENFLSPPSATSSDKTPTQSTFVNQQSIDNKHISHRTNKATHHGTLYAGKDSDNQSLPLFESLLPNSRSGSSLSSSVSDDKTPTQSTYNKYLKKSYPPSLYSKPSQGCSDIPIVNISSANTNIRIKTSHTSSSLDRTRQPNFKLVPDNVSDICLNNSESSMITENAHVFEHASALPVPCLKHAQWLRDIIVELWIDQEGFRAIRPKFYLASVSNSLQYTPSIDTRTKVGRDIYSSPFDDPLFTTVAEFFPVSRTAHYFHHATLDRAPTLNRIAANGEETRDYITRAATLVIRDNGVFFVQGTEDYHVEHDPSTTESLGSGYGHGEREHIIRLNWRFEYFVSSRRPDGRSSHKGERMFTPLSFSCTPALLAPERAHKVKVLHIMKKTLLPNLVAQKLEPPDFPYLRTQNLDPISSISNKLHALNSQSSVASLVSASLASLPVSDSIASFSSQKSIGGILSKAGIRITGGRKAASHIGHAAPPKVNSASSPIEKSNSQATRVSRHRRGSHSETIPEEIVRLQNKSIRVSSHGRTHSVPKPSVELIGPIIPREELLRIFECESKDKDIRNGICTGENTLLRSTLPVPPRHR